MAHQEGAQLSENLLDRATRLALARLSSNPFPSHDPLTHELLKLSLEDRHLCEVYDKLVRSTMAIPYTDRSIKLILQILGHPGDGAGMDSRTRDLFSNAGSRFEFRWGTEGAVKALRHNLPFENKVLRRRRQNVENPEFHQHWRRQARTDEQRKAILSLQLNSADQQARQGTFREMRKLERT